MSTAVLDAPVGPAEVAAPGPHKRWGTVADLITELGDLPAERIRMIPHPGTASVADLEAADAAEPGLWELVDGTLVEKPMGTPESRLAVELGVSVGIYLRGNDIGCMTGPDGGMKLEERLVRKPDFAVVRWDTLPGRKMPKAAYPAVAPTLAVEILSPSNTRKEMRRKRREYFEAGTVEVWEVEVPTRVVRVYTTVDKFTTLLAGDDLDGGAILPGFKQNINAWFDWTFRDDSH